VDLPHPWASHECADVVMSLLLSAMDDNHNNPSYMYTKHTEILTLLLNFKKKY